MVMLLQDNDPHHLHPDPNYVYYFVISAMILVPIVFFVVWQLMSFLDRRYERKKTSEKDSEAAGSGKEEEMK